MIDPLRAVITPETIERWIAASQTPELVERLEVATARGEFPEHPVERARVRYLRARRVAWDAYLCAADAVGLLDSELIERLRAVDADKFRPAMAECMTVWYLAGKLALPIVPRPPGRNGRVLEMAIESQAGNIAVEVKSPRMPDQPREAGAVPSEREEFEAVLRAANRQFPTTGRNLLFVVPRRDSMFTTYEYELVRALIGEHVIAFDIDRSTGGRLGETRSEFRLRGRLTRGGAQPMYTRVSAVVCLEEWPQRRFPSAFDVFARGARSSETLNEAHRLYFTDANAVRMGHSVVVVHNPNAREPVDPSLFADARQLIVVDGGNGMRWIGERAF